MSSSSSRPTADQRIVVELDVPAESALDQEHAQRLARESFYVELYRLGAIGSGRAATLLGVDRSAFLDLLSSHGISWWDEQIDMAQDARNARP